VEEAVALSSAMNKQGEKGSVQWFENSRMRCVDHLRALLSIKMARANATEILHNWNSQSAEIKGALHAACIISYARPFSHSAVKTGKITYPTRRLMSATGFDKDLHKHLMDLRNQIIAHGDYGVFPSTMYLQTIGDTRFPVTLGINVKSMCGIESRDLALRYERHLSICNDELERILNLECAELTSEAKCHPDAFNKTHNIPEVCEGATPLDSDFRNLPGPTGPAAIVANPSFPEGLSDYSYITLTHQVPLIESGEYLITVDGVEKKITFSR
jgi:hypothetical protein